MSGDIFVLTNATSSGASNTETVGAGDYIYVAVNVYVVDEGTTSASCPIYGSGWGTAQIDGAIDGYNGVVFQGTAGQTTTIQIATTGTISTFGVANVSPNTVANGAVSVQTGGYYVDNAGVIDSEGDGVDLDYNSTNSASGSGGGTFINYGAIDSSAATGVFIGDSGTSDTNIFDNYGTISGTGNETADSYAMQSYAGEILLNAGTMNGIVYLAAEFNQASSVTDSGVINGALLLDDTFAGLNEVTVASTGIIEAAAGLEYALYIGGPNYDFVNNGEIRGASSPFSTAVRVTGDGTTVNKGTISAVTGDGIDSFSKQGDDEYIYNYGTISSGDQHAEAIDDEEGHTDTIYNYGAIDAESVGRPSNAASAINAGASTTDHVVNGAPGTIVGQVVLDGADSSVTNDGEIDGLVSLGDDAVLTNKGAISGSAELVDDAILVDSGALSAGVSIAAGTTFAQVTVTDTGSITGAIFGAALEITSGTFKVVNNGEIDASVSPTGGQSDDGIETHGSGSIYNGGKIEGGDDGVEFFSSTATTSLYNHGLIEGGSDGVVDLSSASMIVDNYGAIDGAGTFAIFTPYTALTLTLLNYGTIGGSVNAAGQAAVVNTGLIAGQLSGGENSSLLDSGTITGGVALAGDAADSDTCDVRIEKTGVVDSAPGAAALAIAGGAYDISNAGEIVSTSLDPFQFADGIDVTGFSDGKIVNSATGEIDAASIGVDEIITAGAIDYLYNYGAISAGLVAVNDTGGHVGFLYNYGSLTSGGINDDAVYSSVLETMVNTGVIVGGVALVGATSSLTNSGQIDGNVYFGAGAVFVNKGDVDGNITFSGTGNLYRGEAAGSVAGTITGTGVNSVYYGDAGGDTFNLVGAGAQLVEGGAGANTFIFGPKGLPGSQLVGGSNPNNVLDISAAGTLLASAFAHVTQIETIDLANGANFLQLSNGVVTSAYDETLTVHAGSGVDTLDASLVTSAAAKVQIQAGAGPDTMIAGGGSDTFAFTAVSQSTGPTYDTIANVNFVTDYFQIPSGVGSITAIDAPVTTGVLSTSSFNANLVTALGASHLAADSAVLFTPATGTLAGDTFLVVDPTATAGYAASSDFVFRLAGQTGGLSSANFT